MAVSKEERDRTLKALRAIWDGLNWYPGQVDRVAEVMRAGTVLRIRAGVVPRPEPRSDDVHRHDLRR